jgi:putative transposase
VSRYIDGHRDRFGVEPICRALQVAPSTYYAAKHRPPSARAVRDAELAGKLRQLFDDN